MNNAKVENMNNVHQIEKTLVTLRASYEQLTEHYEFLKDDNIKLKAEKEIADLNVKELKEKVDILNKHNLKLSTNKKRKRRVVLFLIIFVLGFSITGIFLLEKPLKDFINAGIEYLSTKTRENTVTENMVLNEEKLKIEVIKQGDFDSSYMYVSVDGKQLGYLEGYYYEGATLRLIKKDSANYLLVDGNFKSKSTGSNIIDQSIEIEVSNDIEIILCNHCAQVEAFDTNANGAVKDVLIPSQDGNYIVGFDVINNKSLLKLK